MRSVLGELLAPDGRSPADVVVDMEAGLEHLSRGTTRHVDALFAVAEPYYRSLETARRVCELGIELGIRRVQVLANKSRDPGETDGIRAYAERHGLSLAAEVPFDEAVVEADREAGALLDRAGPDSPVVHALDRLARSLVRAETELPGTLA